MNRLEVHLLDLSDEILLLILKKLNNIDVLYSFLNINNERLNILAQEKIFSHILSFVSVDDISLINRFCIDILPRIHDNVKYFILKPVLMERILVATHYPNLTNLKLLNFKKEIALHYFTNELPLRDIFQQQITDLILINHDTYDMMESSKDYSVNIYAHILHFFKKLKHLSIIETMNQPYPHLTLHDSPSTTFFSSTLTHLCINVMSLDDCLYILDGRLKQLITFIVRIDYIGNASSIIDNMSNIPNLKCFSLTSYTSIDSYDDRVLPLLRRMPYLEKLTLYLRINDRDRFIDGTHLQDEILVYMPQLNSFAFYICTYAKMTGLVHHLSNEDIQRTFTNIRQQHVTSVVNYNDPKQIVCYIFSMPFLFDRLEDIGQVFPNIIFSYVTYLTAEDVVSFNREFFIRVGRAFPLLKKFRIANVRSAEISNLENGKSFEIAEYPRLIYLDMLYANIDYLKQFLNEKVTYVPCLEKLRVVYNSLRVVTNNFTREETRRNCAKVTQLLMRIPLVCSKDFYLYFPLL